MSILNLQSDGLYPLLITLARTVVREKSISRDNLISLCVPMAGAGNEGDKDPAVRARATLTRWINLGLFLEAEGQIRLNVDVARGETADAFEERLAGICRRLALHPEHGLPLWPDDGSMSDDGNGRTADLCRGLAWCLSQDIYTLPSTFNEIESLLTTQLQPGRFIVLNDTRWPGLRSWARALGFATGEDSSFFWDPTEALRNELTEIILKKELVPAAEFIARLAARLPVFDSGSYRQQVEAILKPETWKAPVPGQLSTALSFALRCLQKQGTIGLVTMADAGVRVTLSGQGGRTWDTFTHVRMLKDPS